MNRLSYTFSPLIDPPHPHPTAEVACRHVATLFLFALPDGTLREVPAGGLIGRSADAALSLDDERISEAHALVSAREGGLWLLALRGGLSVNGTRAAEARLSPGQRVELAPGVQLEVSELRGIEGEVTFLWSGGRQRLLVSRYTLVDGELRPGFLAQGSAFLWWVAGEGFWFCAPDRTAALLRPGVPLQWGGALVALEASPGAGVVLRGTQRRGEVSPLTLTVRGQTVLVTHPNRPQATITGNGASVLRVLIKSYLAGTPTQHWRAVLRMAWDPKAHATTSISASASCASRSESTTSEEISSRAPAELGS